MTITKSGYMVFIGTVDTEVVGPFTIQAITYSNSTGAVQWATLYIRQDDGTTGVAGSGTDKMLIRAKVPKNSAVSWVFNQAITAPKLISTNNNSNTMAFNVYLR